MATYTKLRDGSWGVRVQGSATAGTTVTVTKKSGETKSELIAKVLWTDGKITICSVAQTGGARHYRSGSSGSCCDNCGRHGARFRRSDSSGISGLVCSTCNRDSQYELSFA